MASRPSVAKAFEIFAMYFCFAAFIQSPIHSTMVVSPWPTPTHKVTSP
jgi:hypothetical protein